MTIPGLLRFLPLAAGHASFIKAGRFLAAAALVCGAAMVRAADLPLTAWQGQTMGSTYTVKLVDDKLSEPALEALKIEVDERLKEVNRQMSHYQPDSELSRFNRSPAGAPFKVSPEFARVTRFSLEMNRRSGGAFDPTLAPVINLWGFGEQTSQRVVPSDADLKAALAKTGWQHLSVTEQGELLKDIPDLGVNLSAAAKGFGVDEMAQVLRGHGLTNFYVSISGETFTLGHNPWGTNWQVGISAPVSNWRVGDPMVTVLSLSGRAVSTSGDYQKFFMDPRGRRLSHILDPRTGKPVQHNLGGVSVVADNCLTADALSTTLFVLGAEEGSRFIETWTNAAALFVIRASDGTFQSLPSSRFSSLTGYHP